MHLHIDVKSVKYKSFACTRVKHFHVDAQRVNMTRIMSMLPDDTYNAFIIDANNDDDANIACLELTITSGSHKGDVISVRAANLARDTIELIGLPVQLIVRDGTPNVVFD